MEHFFPLCIYNVGPSVGHARQKRCYLKPKKGLTDRFQRYGETPKELTDTGSRTLASL